jgi:hypothetical protein
VVVPDLPGLRQGETRPETFHETVEVARAVSKVPDARDGGGGPGRGLHRRDARTARRREGGCRKTRSVVAGVAPYADVKTLLRIATTGHYQENGRLLSYEADPYVTGAITQSLVSTLPPARIGRRSSRSWRRWTG